MTTLDECIGDARDTLIEQAEYDREYLAGMSEDRVRDWLSEHQHEAVDGAVPIYYSDIFAVLADARAYTQDINELGGATDDMSKNAQIAIYMAIDEALNEDESLIRGILDIAEEASA